MKLTITTPSKKIYEGEIQSITIPTESGIITIDKEGQAPIVSATKPGLIKIMTGKTITNNNEFIVSKNEIIIGIGKGMVFADAKMIRIVASQATTIPNHSQAILEQNKQDIEEQIKKLRSQGSIEKIELYMTKLQTINTEISLEKIKQAA